MSAGYGPTQIGDGNPDGYNIGRATTDKIGFYGVTPIVQRASAAQAQVTTTTSTSTSPWGYGSQAQANAIVTLVNEIQAALVAVGIIKGAA